MNNKQKDFVNLLASATLKTSVDNIITAFEELEELAISNCCASIVCQGAVNINVPLPKQWKDAAFVTAIRNYKNLSVQKKVLKILNENSIDCVVIKGITAAVNYPDPMCRALGDIDILVKPQDYELAVSLFGHTTEDNNHKFHKSFTYEDVSVEIHKYIDDYSTCIKGDKLEDLMKNALDNIEYISYENYQIPTLAVEYQALVYLSHMIRHFDENALSMRMFCDWVTFVNSVNDEDWNSKVYPYIKKAELDHFSDALCLASAKYMGSNMDKRVKNQVNNDVINILMNEFLNADKSSSENHLAGNVASLYSKKSNQKDGFVSGTIKSLNELSYRNFPKISKFKATLPFCWIYLILRYLLRVVLGKHQMLKYSKLIEDTNQKKFIKNELNL